MTTGELEKLLTRIPPSARVYTYADHGQTAEQCYDLQVACVLGVLPYYGEDIEWHTMDEISEEDMKKINAVLIG